MKRACPRCALRFWSDEAFADHRTPTDRCLSSAQMRAAGWEISVDGWWRNGPSQDPVTITNQVLPCVTPSVET
jgi:hypothetical protein